MRFRSLTTKSLAAGLALAVGVPAVALAAHPFDDVPDGEWYSEAVDWAYNVGLTTGKTPTTFNGWDNTNRYEMVTMFDRFNDSLVAPLATAIDELEADVAALQAGDGDPMAMQFAMFDSAVNDDPGETTSSTPAPGGLTATVTIPEGYKGVIEAELTAESLCHDGVGFCHIDLLVDGNSISVDGADQAFDSTDGNTNTQFSWNTRTIRAVSGELDAGTYDVTYTAAVSLLGATFRVDDVVLTAQVHLTDDDSLDFVIAGE